SANGDIIKECERRLRVMDAVIKYITVRTDEDVRRLEKIKNYRQKRAARRGSGSRSAAGQSAEEAMQLKHPIKKNVRRVKSSTIAAKKSANFASKELIPSTTKT